MTGIGALSRRESRTIAGALMAIALFYLWTATSNGWLWWPTPANRFYYAQLARAFLAGQLNLLVQPSAQLLALRDPYDPAQNAPFRLHDAVLFNGKYYLYYGPSPALLLFAPFRLLTGLDFTEPLAVAIFCAAGLVYAFLLLQFLARTYLPETPFPLLLAAVPALGFGNVAPFLLRRPVQYEVAISGGYAFAFASLYYYAIGSLGERVRLRPIVFGSILLGLAGGARFPMFAAGLVPLALAGYITARRWGLPLRQHVVTVLAFFGPVSACLFLLGLYNYARFGSWTEFGMRYTLQAYQSAQTYRFYSAARVPAGLFYYVLAPPRFSTEFPFFTLDPARYLKPPPDYYLEAVGGLLSDSPVTSSLVLSPLALLVFRRDRGALYLVGASLLVIGLVLLALYCFSAGTMRYEVDFATFFLIPALFLWFGALNMLKPGSKRRALAGPAFGFLVLATVAFNAAFGLVGYWDSLRLGEPDTYEAIHDVFRPVEWFLR